MFYFDYITSTIINDVETLPRIWETYTWYSSWFVIWCWIVWILLKNILLLIPIWILWNMTIGGTINKMRKVKYVEKVGVKEINYDGGNN